MSIIRPITSLDFDQIKAEIITFIKSNPTFSDYNFEGSALNTIADMLAYNTHSNAYYANMLHNEGFIDTAQKRSSVVSRAKELGYTPRSAVCSVAYVDVSTTVVENQDQIYIERGTPFTSVNDSGTHTFSVVDTIPAIIVANKNTFDNLKLVNGIRVSNYFRVDTLSNPRSMFTIPNKRVDTSTLKVYVRDSISSVEKVEYFLAENVYELVSNSRVYFLQESYDGYFQIYFGDDVIGKQPISSNVVDVDYFVAENMGSGDGCRLFTTSAVSDVVTTQVSFGGSDKETLESIKFNAVKSNSAKSRAVTPSDYTLLLKEKFDFIRTASVWGGEDNVPPVYGKVFVSIQPVSGYTISDDVKREVITPVVRANSLMTIGVEYVDPTYIDLHFVTRVKFSTTKTLSTKFEIEGLIKTVISTYVDSISTFNKDYLESTLISKISAVDSGIMSVNIGKRVGVKLTPRIGIESTHIKYINNEILSGSISSNKFFIMVGGEEVLVDIREVLDKEATTVSNSDYSTTEYTSIGLYDDSGFLLKEIGSIAHQTGKINITFNVASYASINRSISLLFSLVSDDVMTSRNQILRLAKSFDTIGVDNNNTVFVENYGK